MTAAPHRIVPARDDPMRGGLLRCDLPLRDLRIALAWESVPHVVAGGQLLLVQRQIDTAQAVFELFRSARPDDSARDSRPVQHPGERDVRQALSARLEEPAQRL